MAPNRDPFLTDAEEKAVRRAERAIEALPKSIALYFHGTDASVVACDEDGYMLMDREAILGSIGTRRCKAGDW